MAENILPEVIPGMVAVEYVGADNKESNEHKGMTKNVFPIDAKELIATGKYKLVDNGAVEAARLAATPLRSAQAANPDVVVTEVAGIGGQVVVEDNAKDAEAARAAPDKNTPEAVDKAASKGK
jgi:hypothetical protein